jgi:hypothetical protein
MEGFYVPGSKPQRNNNPGDLEHAPGETHEGMDPIGSFATVEAGWAALERQLGRYANRGMTLQQLVEVYAPPVENNTQLYLGFVCGKLRCQPGTLVSTALTL